MSALETSIDILYQRHLTLSQNLDWGYHRLLPFEIGRNFIDDPWQASQGTLSPEMTLAVETAMLTEINLPWFTSTLMDAFAAAPASLLRFVHTWTREEDQHGRVLDVYLLLSRNGDPDRRASLQKSVIEAGWLSEYRDPFALMVYTTLQELATRVFYLNLARAVAGSDPGLAVILRTIAKDETLHYTFYRDAVAAYIDADPTRLVTLCKVIPTFTMPGFGMPDFSSRMKVIASHAGYGITEYQQQVLQVILQAWGVMDYTTASMIQEPRQDLTRYLHLIDKLAKRSRRERQIGNARRTDAK
ncbi:MAG: acyl-ACP desaturase [Firmicutes bacterium]|nr:acyl-ACP desaturase [Bacillota bacterium]